MGQTSYFEYDNNNRLIRKTTNGKFESNKTIINEKWKYYENDQIKHYQLEEWYNAAYRAMARTIDKSWDNDGNSL